MESVLVSQTKNDIFLTASSIVIVLQINDVVVNISPFDQGRILDYSTVLGLFFFEIQLPFVIVDSFVCQDLSTIKIIHYHKFYASNIS